MGVMDYVSAVVSTSAFGKHCGKSPLCRDSIPSTDVGKEADREIFSPVSDASV